MNISRLRLVCITYTMYRYLYFITNKKYFCGMNKYTMVNMNEVESIILSKTRRSGGDVKTSSTKDLVLQSYSLLNKSALLSFSNEVLLGEQINLHLQPRFCLLVVFRLPKLSIEYFFWPSLSSFLLCNCWSEKLGPLPVLCAILQPILHIFFSSIPFPRNT